MTNIQKFTLAKCFQSSFFWMGIAAFFFDGRGFSPEQIYIFFSVYSIGMVIFEYPTGVIADRFSYKSVLAVGSFLMGTSFFLNLLPLSFSGFIIVFLLGSFYGALISGSDNALLHHISSDFKKDFAHIRAISLLVRAGSVALGGWIFTFAPAVPYLLTGIAYVIAALIFLSIDDPQKGIKAEKSSSLAIAREGLAYVFREKLLLAIILFVGSVSAIMISIKWTVPTFYDVSTISPGMFATAFSVGTLMTALGAKLSVSKKFRIPFHYSALFLILSVAFIGMPYGWVIVTAMVVSFFFLGFVDVEVVDIINTKALDKARASILSLRNLSGRIIAALYVFLLGYVLHVISPSVLMVLVALLLSALAFIVVLGMRWEKRRA